MKILFFTFVGCIHLCHSYPAGPPTAACASMTPLHGANAQTSAVPYTITTNVNSYKKGSNITVTITASTAGTPFKGFFLQARTSGSTNAAGRFFIGNEGDAQLMTCPGGALNAVAHNSPADKTSKTFTWTSTDESDVTFYGTFVNNKTTFWINVTSPAVTYTSGGSTPMCHLGLLLILTVAFRFLI